MVWRWKTWSIRGCIQIPSVSSIPKDKLCLGAVSPRLCCQKYSQGECGFSSYLVPFTHLYPCCLNTAGILSIVFPLLMPLHRFRIWVLRYLLAGV